MNRVRVSMTVVGVIGLVCLFTLVPVPIGHIRATGLVQLPSDGIEAIYAPASATLTKLHVRDGQMVAKGELLAEFHSLELERGREEARSQHDIRLVHARALRERVDMVHDGSDRAVAGLALARTNHERDLFVSQIAVYDQALKQLEVRSPRAGVVLGAPRAESLGRHWDKNDATPLCKIGAPGRMQALIPLSEEDYRLLKEMLRVDAEIMVTMRVPGRDMRTWKGKVHRLSEANAQSIPPQLSIYAGGSVPASTQPGGKEPRPLAPHYLATVDFLECDAAICPGTMAEVKVPCQWRTCSWWLWRILARTFDLGLL